MKKKLLRFAVIGLALAVAMAVGCMIGVFASNGSVMRELFYRDIRVTLDDQTLRLQDASGKEIEPFIMDGTTYLPVRAIAEALQLEVDWDGAQNTVALHHTDGDGYRISDTGFRYEKNLLGRTVYRGFVEITNTGSDNLYLRQCAFELQDDSGRVLQSDKFVSKCPDILEPGEKGYFYTALGSHYIDSSVTVDNGIHLVSQPEIEVAKSSATDYTVSDLDLRAGLQRRPTLSGTVTNDTDADVLLLPIYVVYYDASGEALGIVATAVSGLSAGDSATFEASGFTLPSSVTVDTVESYRVIARAGYFQ